MSKDHDFIIGFIEIYRSFACLWKKTGPQYHNAVKREKLLQDFVRKV
jgi:hypothetical protein